MVNFKKLTDRAKDVVEKRGGSDALKADAQELKNIAKGKGSIKDKAKAAREAVSDPGRKGPDAKPDAPTEDAPKEAQALGVTHAQPPVDSADEADRAKGSG